MTRSVAEIIGWCPVPDDPTQPSYDVEGYGRANHEPTPDDLLAWLRERSVHRIEMHYSKGWADVIVGDTYHEAPTLLAALEMAVRAVAGES